MINPFEKSRLRCSQPKWAAQQTHTYRKKPTQKQSSLFLIRNMCTMCCLYTQYARINVHFNDAHWKILAFSLSLPHFLFIEIARGTFIQMRRNDESHNSKTLAHTFCLWEVFRCYHYTIVLVWYIFPLCIFWFPVDSFQLSHKYLLLHSFIWHYFMLVICLRHDTFKLLFIWLFYFLPALSHSRTLSSRVRVSEFSIHFFVSHCAIHNEATVILPACEQVYLFTDPMCK